MKKPYGRDIIHLTKLGDLVYAVPSLDGEIYDLMRKSDGRRYNCRSLIAHRLGHYKINGEEKKYINNMIGAVRFIHR